MSNDYNELIFNKSLSWLSSKCGIYNFIWRCVTLSMRSMSLSLLSVFFFYVDVTAAAAATLFIASNFYCNYWQIRKITYLINSIRFSFLWYENLKVKCIIKLLLIGEAKQMQCNTNAIYIFCLIEIMKYNLSFAIHFAQKISALLSNYVRMCVIY